MREDEMDDTQDLDMATEDEGRRMLAAAFDARPAGGALAGDGLAGEEILRRVRRVRQHSTRRVRTLVPAGAVAALGGVAALVVSLTVASAPSALAAVTAAAAKTSAESFRVTSVQTQVTTLSPRETGTPSRVSGVFDPGRGLGEETAADGLLMRFVGGEMYLDVSGAKYASVDKSWAHGKPWLESQEAFAPEPGANQATFHGFAGNEPINPSDLLGLLKSAASVRTEGPASGPGWTGTRYTFTERPTTGKDVTPVTVRGTVYVDGQGRVRRLVTAQTWPVWSSSGVKGSATNTYDVSFGGFGVRVSVTAPPASQVYRLGVSYVYIGPAGSLAVSTPRP